MKPLFIIHLKKRIFTNKVFFTLMENNLSKEENKEQAFAFFKSIQFEKKELTQESKDFIKIDTIPVVTIKWSLKLPDSIISPKERELRSWLQKEMELDTLFIKRD